MVTIQSSKEGIEQQFSSKPDQFQHEMLTSQAFSSQQVLEKLSRKAYTFKKKGFEDQFLFNDRVNDRIDTVKSTALP